MTPLWRLLLVVLLAVALPVQGWAAGGGVPCAGRSADALTAVHAMAAAPRAAPCHAVDGAGSAANPATAAATAGVADADAGSCSVCADCCSGIAPPATAAVVAAGPAVVRPLVVATSGSTSHVGGGLERPPRP